MNRLKGPRYCINTDYSAETEPQHRALYPVLKAACQLSQFKDKVKLQVDKHMDDKIYTTENTMDLSEPINPSKLATKMDDHLVCFCGRPRPLSNTR